jgi:hypothetical protein
MSEDPRVNGAVDLLAASLRNAAVSTGGWGYYPARRPRIEPTCWALMALQAVSDDANGWEQFASPHVAILKQSQMTSGGLSDTGGATTNLAFDGLAAAVLPHVADRSTGPVLSALLSMIAGVKGFKAQQGDLRQDNSLQAWPWYPDNFSWVEPTAWCVLALKKSPDAQSDGFRARIDEAERMLENRCCDAGGWNYGNASALGQDLRPHVPTTALALIALQDRADREFVKRSVDLLEQVRFKEESSLALGLTATALHVYGRPKDDVCERLTSIASRSVERGNVYAMAVALFALTLDRHNAKVLRVA